MNEKKKGKISIVKILIYAFFVIMSVIYLAPLLWVFSVSFKTNGRYSLIHLRCRRAYS